jgi:hypothetical protein
MLVKKNFLRFEGRRVEATTQASSSPLITVNACLRNTSCALHPRHRLSAPSPPRSGQLGGLSRLVREAASSSSDLGTSRRVNSHSPPMVLTAPRCVSYPSPAAYVPPPRALHSRTLLLTSPCCPTLHSSVALACIQDDNYMYLIIDEPVSFRGRLLRERPALRFLFCGDGDTRPKRPRSSTLTTRPRSKLLPTRKASRLASTS